MIHTDKMSYASKLDRPESPQFPSGEAEELNRGIRDSIKGRRLSIIAMGLGLASIKAKNLYSDLGCQSMTQYIQRLCDETKMDRSSIFKWLYIGEAYRKYQNNLEEIGFSDSDGPTKLSYLNNALEKNEKQEVFDNIKSMSLREFILFSKGTPVETETSEPYTSVQDSRVYTGNRFTVKINTKLNRRSFVYFRKLISIADKAIEEGEVIIPIRLRNMEEARRFERASVRLINKLRKEA